MKNMFQCVQKEACPERDCNEAHSFLLYYSETKMDTGRKAISILCLMTFLWMVLN